MAGECAFGGPLTAHKRPSAREDSFPTSHPEQAQRALNDMTDAVRSHEPRSNRQTK